MIRKTYTIEKHNFTLKELNKAFEDDNPSPPESEEEKRITLKKF